MFDKNGEDLSAGNFVTWQGDTYEVLCTGYENTMDGDVQPYCYLRRFSPVRIVRADAVARIIWETEDGSE